MGRLIILARYWNDMDMLQASLDQIDYWTKDIESKVYLAEGAWDQKLDARSKDGTREYLENWSKKRSNVLVIDNVRADENYRINQADTSNFVMSLAEWQPDDWMVIVDVDQFYTKADIDAVKEIIKSDQYDFFAYKVCNFLYDLQHCQETIDLTQSRLPSRLVQGSYWQATNHLTVNGNFYNSLKLKMRGKILTTVQGLHYEGLRPKSRLDLRYSVGNRKSFWEYDNGSRLKKLVPFVGKHSEFVMGVLKNVNFSEEIENEFVEKVLPLNCVARGILVSEGFAFCAFCKLYNIDMIIESGVYNGQSTIIWSKFFDKNIIEIVSFDITLRESIAEKFDHFNNILLCKGDGRIELPLLIKANLKKRIAVFIDGPKGINAVNLAKKCFSFDNVFVAGIHDTHKISFGKPNKTRIVIDTIPEFKFHTDDSKFVEKYSYMDSPSNFVGQGTEDVYWAPYELVNKISGAPRLLGSYGMTISFMLKDIK